MDRFTEKIADSLKCTLKAIPTTLTLVKENQRYVTDTTISFLRPYRFLSSMNRLPDTQSAPRLKVSALLSTEEAQALQKLLQKLTTNDYQHLADTEAEASTFIAVASKMSRQLTAAELIPAMPAYDD